jgi:hypothetical protein
MSKTSLFHFFSFFIALGWLAGAITKAANVWGF